MNKKDIKKIMLKAWERYVDACDFHNRPPEIAYANELEVLIDDFVSSTELYNIQESEEPMFEIGDGVKLKNLPSSPSMVVTKLYDDSFEGDNIAETCYFDSSKNAFVYVDFNKNCLYKL